MSYNTNYITQQLKKAKSIIKTERRNEMDGKKYSLHELTEKEYERNEKFRNKHYKKCNNGNKYIYTLTGTGIGQCIYITCPICGKGKDITDTESW